MLSERIEAWYDRIGKKILYFIAAIIVLYIFLEYVLELVFPFIIAWILASILNPVVTWLRKRFKIPRGFGTLLSMVTVLSALIGAITVIIRQLWIQIQALDYSFDLYEEDVKLLIQTIGSQLEQVGEQIALPSAFSSFDKLVAEIMGYIGGFVDEIIKTTYSILAQVPNSIFLVIVVFIAVFFMTKDYNDIKAFVKAQMPEAVLSKTELIKSGLKGAIGGYVKTQLILMCFTSVICLIGLLILQREYALLIAVAIAGLDALPVFGSGAILIPWGAYYIITGNYMVGVGLLCIYAIIVVVRQIMEPKVLSTQIGVYALVTLMAMYIGLKVLGVFGMILGPVVMVMLKTLQTVGVIPEFKKPPQ